MDQVLARLTSLWETPPTLWGALATVDHKTIGVRYLFTAFAFLALGGIEALVMRLQLAGSDLKLLHPETYNQLFTMHGVTMIFWYAAPILSGFANYLIPLMLGARDMALPRLNAFSYWVFLLSGLFVNAAFVAGQLPEAGWFAYAPYTSKAYSPSLGMDFYALALIFLTVSQTAGAINFLVTIFRLRAPGMSLNRMPLFMYSTATISALSVLCLPALTVACLFLELDRNWGTHFFDTSHGGSALLWQHLFWFFGHPWVYIVFLPATGMVSMIIPVFARRPIVGYAFVAWSTVLTGVVGMGVWVHHMFATGMTQLSMSFFSAASMTISVFSAVQMFAWIATLWNGRPVMKLPLAYAIAFLALFVIGGLNGVATTVIPFDWQLTDTYFVVAHLHYVLVGANVFPVFAALYYWFPKMSGRLMNEKAGWWSFWLMFAGANLAFFPMHLTGLAGMPRRIYTYAEASGWGTLNLAITLAAFVFAAGALITLANALWSMRRGAVAGPNPWNADTLEWSMPSPPPAYAYAQLPTVAGRHPLWDAHDEQAPGGGDRVLDRGRHTLATSWLHARPLAIAKMPEDTPLPLLLALALTALFAGVLLKAVAVTAAVAAMALVLCAAWLWPEAQRQAA